jgi:hypothetical protein
MKSGRDDMAYDGMKAVTDSWQPKPSPENVLRVLGERCRYVESLMTMRSQAEISVRTSNFSSGPSVEAILREELSNLLPSRYRVTCGTVSDRKGQTAGDCDVVIFNDEWFPSVKSRATPDSRYEILPIEGVYGVLEVKQTLTSSSLREAFSKVVPCHRLFRPRSPIGRITENRTFGQKTERVGNPLFSAIIAASRNSSVSMEQLLGEFVAYNRALRRMDVVQCLCVLGEACYMWGWFPNEARELSVAPFNGDDLQSLLYLVEASPEYGETALGGLFSRLLGHLTQTVLSPTDVAVNYGAGDRMIARNDPNTTLLPDRSWRPTDEIFDHEA